MEDTIEQPVIRVKQVKKKPVRQPEPEYIYEEEEEEAEEKEPYNAASGIHSFRYWNLCFINGIPYLNSDILQLFCKL